MTIELKDKLYTSTQVADILGVSLRTLYRYMEDGKINSMRTASGRHRFTRDNILEFLNGDKDVQLSDIMSSGYARQSVQHTEPVTNYDRNISNVQRDTKSPSYQPDPRHNTTMSHSNLHDRNVGNYQNFGRQNSQPLNENPINYQTLDQLKSASDRLVQPNIGKINNEYNDIDDGEGEDTIINVNAVPNKTYKPINNFDFLDDDFLTPKVAKPKEIDYDEEPKTLNSYSLLNDHPKEEESNFKVEYFVSTNTDLVELAKLIKKSSAEYNLNYAFTGYAGASLYFPTKPFTLLHLYIDKYDYNFWIKTLDLSKSTDIEANIGLIIDQSFRYIETKSVGGFIVVNNTQLKKDLENMKEFEIAAKLG